MNFIIILSMSAVLLFCIAYVTKRRIGLLGLALAAGAYLESLWASDLTAIVEGMGLTISQPPLESVVSAILIIGPALVLSVTGTTYSKKSQRLISSVVFAVFAAVLLLEPLGLGLIIENIGKQVYDLLIQNRQIIITVCLLASIIDLLLTKIPKPIVKH